MPLEWVPYLLILGIGIGLLKFVEKLLSRPRKVAPDGFPYRLRDDFLSATERNLYLNLVDAVGESAIICPKVSLGDLFYAAPQDKRQWRAYTSRIDRKHVDFLLCRPGKMTPLLGVELDDASHKRADRQTRDQLVERVFEAAGLPLLRVPAHYDGYNAAALRESIGSILRIAPGEPTPAGVTEPEAPATLRVSGPDDPPVAVSESASTPGCPKCGREMVQRTASRGANRGEVFWGCPGYPRCRGTREHVPAGGAPASSGAE